VCGATPPPAVGAVGSWTCAPPGAGWTVGEGGFGIGAALTGPTPNETVVMAMPAAIAAALAARERFFVITLDSRRRTVWTGVGDVAVRAAGATAEDQQRQLLPLDPHLHRAFVADSAVRPG
jgi:hypothetical protein